MTSVDTDHSQKPYVVGVDLGGTNVRAAVLERASEKIVARGHNLPSLALDGVAATAGQIALAAETALKEAGVSKADVLGVGVAVPGVVKAGEGKVMWAPNFKDQWKGVAVAQPVQDALRLPVQIGNDANLAALGEFRFGVGREVRHLAMITLGTGIGGGIIVDGKLLEGADGGAAEVGHMIVNPGGRGGRAAFGSVEGESARDAITERAARKIQEGYATTLADVVDYDRFALTPAIIAQEAQNGDQVAIEVFEETGYYLGLCVANLINILNPEMVVIGGGIAQAGELILEPIRRTAYACAVRSLSRSCRIVPADLGDNAGIFGGAALVLQGVEEI
ncbi:MAG: ROK family protein [Armatimonadetes bacterium]|nr:ROK family protein [Armatimonadota bacterium]